MFAPLPRDAAGRSRLLPVSIPFRYLGAAVVFLLIAWPLVFLGADSVPRFAGGLGPVLGALHALTLGVLVMTAIGASLQLLPVATVQAVGSVRLARALWWLLVPGVTLVVTGMAFGSVRVLAGGSVPLLVALVLFAWLLGSNLAYARRQRLSVVHGWIAWSCLLLVIASAGALVLHYLVGLPLRLRDVAGAHLIVAAYGFLGFLVLGFSYLLLPMFAVAKAPSSWVQAIVLAGSVLALLLGALSVLFAVSTEWLAVAAGLGAISALVHVLAMVQSLRRRLRRAREGWTLLVGCAWVALPLSLAIAALHMLGRLGERAPTLFGALLIVGWLLSFVLGVLERIVPFLASVHALRPGAPPPLASRFVIVRTVRIHRGAYLSAVALLLAGIAIDAPPLVRLAAAFGCVAAAAFAWFFVIVVYRLRGLRRGAMPGASSRSDVLPQTAPPLG
jgi:hypothetical protein